MKLFSTQLILAVCAFYLGFNQSTFGASNEKEKKLPEMTQEQRVIHADWMEKRAEAYKKMADCLKSDRPSAECHEEWHKMLQETCPMAKNGHCHMMDEFGGHHANKHSKEK